MSKAKLAKVAEVREEWMLSGEASAFFRRPARKVKELLRKHAVPLVEFTQRDWQVRRSLVEGLVERLERESLEAAEQEDLQRDFCRPAAERPTATRRSRSRSAT